MGFNDVKKIIIIIINKKKQFGQLGIGNLNIGYSSNWNLIMNNIIDISCGEYHTLIINNNNELFSFGLNNVNN